MWESLGSSRRQDRVLHGAAKALNVAVGSVALPTWLIGQRLRGPLRTALARLDPAPAELPTAQPRERTMDALMADLESIPNALRPSEAAMLRKGVADMSTFVLAQQREAANLGYAYPSQFSDHVFEGSDGEHIAASVGLHQGSARPGLIVEHGLEGGGGHRGLRQVPQGPRIDDGRSARNLAGWLLGARRLPSRWRRRGARRRHTRDLPPERSPRDGEAALQEAPPLASGVPPQPGALGDAHLPHPPVPMGGRPRLRRSARAD